LTNQNRNGQISMKDSPQHPFYRKRPSVPVSLAGAITAACGLISSAASAQEADPELQALRIRHFQRIQSIKQSGQASQADALKQVLTLYEKNGNTAGATLVRNAYEALLAQLKGTPDLVPKNEEDMDKVFEDMQAESGSSTSEKSDSENSTSSSAAGRGRGRYAFDLNSIEGYDRVNGIKWYKDTTAVWKLKKLPPGKYKVRCIYRVDPEKAGSVFTLKTDAEGPPGKYTVKAGNGRHQKEELGDLVIPENATELKLTIQSTPKDGQQAFELLRLFISAEGAE
jgi:hypothetical protein